ncbi:MAG: hypothetical protein SGPRY_007551, partial [Prymnesium sp.]
VPAVRASAARALFRLQDPSSASDEITLELLRLMSDDASKEVRIAAISTIAPSKHAIEAIVARTRDVALEVRVHALKVLRDKVEMRWLSIWQRASVLRSTLADREEKVRTVARELLTTEWLTKHSEKNVLKLLKALDVVAQEDAARQTMVVLLENEETRALVAEAAGGWGEGGGKYQLEAVFSLRSLLDYYASQEAEGKEESSEEMEKVGCAQRSCGGERSVVSPQLPDFCLGLKAAVARCDEAAGRASSVAANFTLSQLLAIGARLDMSNEHGRGQLEKLLCKLIKSLSSPVEMLPNLFEALQTAYPGDLASFHRLVLELVSEIEDPLEVEEREAVATRKARTEADVRLQREQSAMLAQVWGSSREGTGLGCGREGRCHAIPAESYLGNSGYQAKLGELMVEIKAALEEDDVEKAEELRREAAGLKREVELLTSAGGDEAEAVQRTARCMHLLTLMLRR